MEHLIFVINPGSTSTKVALYRDDSEVFNENIEHSQEEFECYERIIDQIPARLDFVSNCLGRHGYAPPDLAVVMGRGGLFPPLHTGGYKVNKRMLDMILNEEIPPHASNLGAVLAHEIAVMAGVDAYIYDAVSAADFPQVAKITGMKEVERKSFCHALNSRAVAIRYASSQGKAYEDMNLIVSHLGGGITVSVHEKGKIIDSLSDDNGPFAPERSGSVPLLDVIDMCFSGKYTKKEMFVKVRGKGGLRDLIGTSDGRKIEHMLQDGDEHAALIMHAQAYQIAKGVGLLSPALKGDCDAIILTGGFANIAFLVDMVEEYISFLAPVVVMPGEFEMEALALGGLRILTGLERAREM